MANWSKLRPLGFAFLSKLFSPEMSAIDNYLTKTPNLKEGSNHNIDVGQTWVVGGPGSIHFSAPFQADAADITIPAGKSLHVLAAGAILTDSGSTSTFNGTVSVTNTATFSGSGKAVFTGAIGWDLNTGSVGYVRNGAKINLTGATILSPAILEVDVNGLISVKADGFVVSDDGSTVNFGGDVAFTGTSDTKVLSGGNLEIQSGASFTMNGTSNYVGINARLSVLGVGGLWSEIRFVNELSLLSMYSATFATHGAIITHEAGTSIDLNSTVVVTDASTTTRTGKTDMSGTGASIAWRVTAGPGATSNITVTSFDLIECPSDPAAHTTYTLQAPAGNRKTWCWLKREINGGSSAKTVFIHDNTGTEIGTFPVGTLTIGFLFAYYNGSVWKIAAWGGNATVTVV